ncbi:MAG: GNAT family N-acetyltransferase [Firmicutes bacterium]|nr:GNAT family N-acetyltransferase [Bacillota bacterium]
MLSEEIIKGLKELHFLSFGDSHEYIEFFFKNWVSEPNCFYTLEDGKVIGALYYRDFTVSLFGEVKKIPFFNAIATHPNYRHRGVARELIDRAVNECGKRGYPFVMLHPFSADFYKNLNFVPISFCEEVNITYKPLKDISEKPITNADIPALKALYNNEAKRYPCHKLRSETEFKLWVEQLMLNPDFGYLICENGIPKGYYFIEGERITEFIGSDINLLFASKKADGKTLRKLSENGKVYSMARGCENLEKITACNPNCFTNDYKTLNIFMYETY